MKVMLGLDKNFQALLYVWVKQNSVGGEYKGVCVYEKE